MVKKGLGGLFFLICVVLSYQGWQNAQLGADTEALSIEAASEDGAVVERDRPNFTRTDPISRRYEWRTNLGQKVVTCRRELVFFGAWSCEAVDGTLGAF